MGFYIMFTSDRPKERGQATDLRTAWRSIASPHPGQSPAPPAVPDCRSPIPHSRPSPLTCHTTCSTWLLAAHTTCRVFLQKKMLSACPLPASPAAVALAVPLHSPPSHPPPPSPRACYARGNEEMKKLPPGARVALRTRQHEEGARAPAPEMAGAQDRAGGSA